MPINIRNTVGQIALHYILRNSHHIVVKQLLENGANVNAKDKDGQI